MAEKILVVEDERALQETLEYNLKRQGYEVQVAGDGILALDLAREFQPEIILLDVMLPGMDGFELCRRLRQEMNTPVLMLTARTEEIDRVVGLEVGADDYMTKPFSMRELLARVKAMLRRVRMIREEMQKSEESTQKESEKRLLSGNLELNLARREVRLNGVVVAVKPKEFELLHFLMKHRGQVLSRDYLLKELWGWDYFGDSRTVDVHIRWLREKIEPDPAHPVRIVTVRGAGYRFEG
ncbi:response regulator transcription factor [Anaerolinea thermophila]|uniref:OmpR family two-component response regulator n=1 Tax=Anaerolinea thermophila (strain DSM 14523 / JCM 11388 / NBRC 100420 / UNI-1) TaxID=926569 RepID=E8MZ67_ANATU|nr:response regulator transcription factor [Anaerolinea thermophila]BAJ62210.1 OmpR family two-component response regulator [Anaerolinea thermophila UNI-1]